MKEGVGKRINDRKSGYIGTTRPNRDSITGVGAGNAKKYK